MSEAESGKSARYLYLLKNKELCTKNLFFDFILNAQAKGVIIGKEGDLMILGEDNSPVIG
jgi:hypothetical protein